MKKITTVLLILALVVSSFSVIAAEEKIESADETTELLNDGSFESCLEMTTEAGDTYLWPSGWQVTGARASAVGVDYTLDETHARTGKYALKIQGGQDENSTRPVRKLPELIPGAAYELTAWVMVEEPIATLGTYMEMRGADSYGTTYGQSEIIKDTNKEWIQISTKFVAPESKQGYIWLYRYGAGGAAYYDDISLKLIDNLAPNESFELVNPTGRDAAQIYKGKSISRAKGKGYEGEAALKIPSGDSAVTTYSAENYLLPGKYTYSAYVKSVKDREVIVTVTSTDATKANINEDIISYKSKSNDWEPFAGEFTVPEGAASVTISISGGKGGDTLLDSVCITSDTIKKAKVDAIAELKRREEENRVYLKPTLEGTGEMIENGDLEILNHAQTGPAGFAPYGGGWGEKSTDLSTVDPHSGKYCVRLKGDGSPWFMYEVPVVVGAEYQVTAWLKRIAESNDMGPYIKYEFYDAEGKGVHQQDSQSFRNAAKVGVWTQVAARVIVPEKSATLKMYFRLNGSGEAYYDDVGCSMTALPKILNVETDEVFYYTGDIGKAVFKASKVSYEVKGEDYYDFTILDGDKVVASHLGFPADQTTTYVFDTSTLAEKGKAYTLRGELKNQSGEIIDTAEETIYRYDKPDNLNDNGEIVVDGQVFTPVIPYHTNIALDIPTVKSVGSNTYTTAIGNDAQGHLKDLDTLHEQGLKVILGMYPDMKPAGHPANMQNTIETVSLVKDHPALIGYLVMDEPYLHDTNDITSGHLAVTYKTIKDIDEKHPIIFCETPYNRGIWKEAQKYCDVFIIDPYPQSKQNLNYLEECVRLAKEASNYETAVVPLTQAFDWMGYLPTGNDLRYQIYSAYFGGADGIGHFRFRSWAEPFNHLWTYTDEDGMWTGLSSYAQNEEADVLNLFIYDKYPVLDFVITEDVGYILYVKGNTPYLIVMNKKNEAQKISIPLTSYNGKVSIGSFTAKAVDMSGAPAVSGDGVFEIELPDKTVAKYELTTTLPDISGITAMRFRDMYRHNWAREAVETLTADGTIPAVNDNAFMPGKNITRGEFAMYLVNTLGLSAEDGENFKDVEPYAEYAEAVRIGKACGILNGVGNNSYRPEAEITRQDFMTIVARALKLAEKADLSQFSDAELIAEYAKDTVSAMVAAGYVKGNADGTINPLGNTTRAEAATIMYRLLQK